MTTQEILSMLKGVKKDRDGWMAKCPAHDDNDPSLKISTGDNGNTLLHCFTGCSNQSICKRLGIKLSDLFLESQKHEPKPLTLSEYAKTKNLPAEFLQDEFDVKEFSGGLVMPYKNDQGKETATRFRLAMTGKKRFLWKRGSKASQSLYNAQRLPEYA